jgi:hypothetical protein
LAEALKYVENQEATTWKMVKLMYVVVVVVVVVDDDDDDDDDDVDVVVVVVVVVSIRISVLQIHFVCPCLQDVLSQNENFISEPDKELLFSIRYSTLLNLRQFYFPFQVMLM